MLTWQAKEAWPNGFRAARLIPAVEYIQANRIRTLVMYKMAELMRTIDVFVVPSFAGNALVLTNLTGNPAVVLPNGFNDKGSPTSITFVGKLDREADVLAVAKAYQDATDFHTRQPPLRPGAQNDRKFELDWTDIQVWKGELNYARHQLRPDYGRSV